MSRNRKCPPVIPDFPLLTTPPLPGARCAGEAPRWDWEIDGEGRKAQRRRHLFARLGCLECPALTLCTDWVADTPRDELDGVIAGTVYPTPGSAAYRAEIGQEVAA